MKRIWNTVKSFLGFKDKEKSVKPKPIVQPIVDKPVINPDKEPGKLIAKDHVKKKRKRRRISKESRRRNRLKK